VAIAGIGATEFSRDSGRSELRLAVEASLSALADAGLSPSDVGGLATFTLDNNDEQAVARALGIAELTFFCRTPAGGGGGCGTVALAAAAIAAGVVEVVICYRAMNERSQYRFGQPSTVGPKLVPTSSDVDASWSAPFGVATPASKMALSARRYMHVYGATSEDFGRVAVTERRYAATNPAAGFYGRPITLADHQASRMVADPLRLYDCCQESDGAVAIVVTSLERAKDLRQAPVAVLAAAQAIGPNQVGMASPYTDNPAQAVESRIVGDQLWKRSGLKPGDIDLAILYDHFAPAVLMQMEALGFCGPGEAPDFLRDGAMEPDGPLPVNTHGGQLGEAYIHGFNGMAEAVRQIRGNAVNQVVNAARVAVTSGSHVPTSGLILGSA